MKKIMFKILVIVSIISLILLIADMFLFSTNKLIFPCLIILIISILLLVFFKRMREFILLLSEIIVDIFS